MKACRVHRFGAPDVIAFEDVERPEPGASQILVRVVAAGVGPWDALIRSGRSGLPQPLPLTLGAEIAGVVERVGASVPGFAVGQDVYGVVNDRFTGGYAEYAAASWDMLAEKPRSLDYVAAASVPVVAVTAWQMLHDRAGVMEGKRVLVIGGAGSVGAFAVQLARKAGAAVAATASAADADYVRGLGADRVVDYHADVTRAGIAPVDIVIDTVGGDAQRASLDLLKPGGILVSSVSAPDETLLKRYGVRGTWFIVDVREPPLRSIGRMIDDGQLQACVGTVLPLAEARAAHEMLAGVRPHPRGKIVLRVSSS